MDLFFGNGYCTGDQEKFTRALNAGKLELALDILQQLPEARLDDPVEQLQRFAFLARGYEAYTKAITGNREIRGYKDLGLPSEIAQSLKLLRVYEAIGKPEEIRSQLELLDKYSDLGIPDEIRSAQKDLKFYEELGDPNEIKSEQKRLQELEKKYDGLDKVINLV
jgi:hypothetical protein